MDRKKFLQMGLAGAAGIWAVGAGARAASPLDDRLPLELVHEFVQAGHNDLPKLKSMLAEHPRLIHARHDWGGGDFEEAIEGAGHLGNREIADFLIGEGARLNIFLMTMMGETMWVIPMLEKYPSLIQARGPHGFTLLHHAKVGGDEAQTLFDYLQTKGLTATKFD